MRLDSVTTTFLGRLKKNFEITALLGDPDFISEVEEMFEADFARSRIIGDGEYRDRPFWFKLAVRLARLTSPVQ